MEKQTDFSWNERSRLVQERVGEFRAGSEHHPDAL